MKWTAPLMALSLSLAATLATAGEIKPYTPQAFDQLTQAGKPLALHVTAPWCPTCKEQKPVLDSLMKQPAYRDVTLLTIDFDTSKPLLKKFKVVSQSTLVAFKGDQEVGRLVGDTDPFRLEALIRKTVN